MSNISTTAGRRRQLYQASTESSRLKTIAVDAAPDSLPPAAIILRQDPVCHAAPVQPSGLLSGRSSAGSAHTREGGASKTPLRREVLAGRAMGLGEPIAVRRPASPSATVGRSANRQLWTSASPSRANHHQSPHSQSEVKEVEQSMQDPPVRVVITSTGPTPVSFARDPVERSVIALDDCFETRDASPDSAFPGGTTFPCDMAFLTDAERRELGTMLSQHIAQQITFKGCNAVAFAFGAPGTGKTTSMYGRHGAAASYCVTLLDELNRTFLSKLWSVHISVVNIVDGQVFDALPRSFHSRRHAERTEVSFDLHQHDADDILSRSATPRPVAELDGIRTPSDPRLLLESLSVTVRDADDVESFFSELVARSLMRTNITWQEVVTVSVVPSLGVQQTFAGLMRSVGTATFVEIGAGMSSDSDIQTNNKAANAQRHCATTVLNVLNAITRQTVKSATSTSASLLVHVPYGDTALTILLEPFISSGKCLLVAHVQESSSEKLASRSTLDAVDQLLRHRFPNGRAPVDYRALARAQCNRADRLQRELNERQRAWDEERLRLESDRLMMKKAYDDVLQIGVHHQEHSKPSPPHPRSLPAEQEMSLNRTIESLKAMLSTAQREKCMLEEQNNELIDRVGELVEEVTRLKQHDMSQANLLAAKSFAQTSKSLPVVELTANALRGVLTTLADADVVKLLPSLSSTNPSAELTSLQAAAVVLQLVHQLCERERSVDAIARKIRSESDVDQPSRRGASSRVSPNKKSSITTELDNAPLLQADAWKAVLTNLQRCMDDLLVVAPELAPMSSLVHFNGSLPKHRSRSGVSLFSFAATSSLSVFQKYWSSQHAFPAALSGSAGESSATGISVSEPSADMRQRFDGTAFTLPSPVSMSPAKVNSMLALVKSHVAASVAHVPPTEADPDTSFEEETTAIEKLARQLTSTLEPGRSQLHITPPSASPPELPILLVTSPSLQNALLHNDDDSSPIYVLNHKDVAELAGSVTFHDSEGVSEAEP